MPREHEAYSVWQERNDFASLSAQDAPQIKVLLYGSSRSIKHITDLSFLVHASWHVRLSFHWLYHLWGLCGLGFSWGENIFLFSKINYRSVVELLTHLHQKISHMLGVLIWPLFISTILQIYKEKPVYNTAVKKKFKLIKQHMPR